MRRWLLLAGAAAPIFYVLVVVVGSIAWPGYSQIDNTISDLMALNAPHHVAVAVGLGLSCLLGAGLGIALIDRLGRHDRRFGISGAAVIMVGVVGAAISFFPVDGVEAGQPYAERIHLTLTGIAFAAIAVAVLTFAFAARHEAGFGRSPRRALYRLGVRRRAAFEALASFSFAMAGVIVASGVATTLAQIYSFDGSGLVERLIVGGYLAWLLVVATALMRRPDGR